jgi:hypothetical protein
MEEIFKSQSLDDLSKCHFPVDFSFRSHSESQKKSENGSKPKPMERFTWGWSIRFFDTTTATKKGNILRLWLEQKKGCKNAAGDVLSPPLAATLAVGTEIPGPAAK